MTGHSTILGGSTAARRLACPASFLEEQRAPVRDTESIYAAEGTYLHEVVTHFVKHKITPEAVRTWDWNKISKFELNGEQLEALAVALEELETLKAKYASPNGVAWKVIALEKLLPLPGVLGAFGSVDLVLVNDVTALVVDWKFGQGVPVYAAYPDADGYETLNPQAVFYALAARAKFKSKFKDRQIVLAIIQPRLTPASSHAEAFHEDLDAFQTAFADAVLQALDRNAHRERGEHCRFANCKATCVLWTGPVFDLAVIDPAAAALEASVKGVEVTEYGDFLGRAMDLAEMAEMWATEIRRQAHVFLEDGGAIRDWKLVPKRGTRQWVDAETAPAELRTIGALDADIFTKPELKSVKQVEDALKPKKIKLPDTLHRMVAGKGTTLARADDARPESTHGAVANELRQALRAL